MFARNKSSRRLRAFLQFAAKAARRHPERLLRSEESLFVSHGSNRSSLRTPFLAALFLFFRCTFPLSGKDRRLLKFYSNIAVLPDASVDVTEHITFQFIGGPWHGIYRDIPVEYAGPRGLNYSLFLSVKSVTDEDGDKLKYETS